MHSYNPTGFDLVGWHGVQRSAERLFAGPRKKLNCCEMAIAYVTVVTVELMEDVCLLCMCVSMSFCDRLVCSRAILND